MKVLWRARFLCRKNHPLFPTNSADSSEIEKLFPVIIIILLRARERARETRAI